jgi:hypothetical protein
VRDSGGTVSALIEELIQKDPANFEGKTLVRIARSIWPDCTEIFFPEDPKLGPGTMLRIIHETEEELEAWWPLWGSVWKIRDESGVLCSPVQVFLGDM